MGRTGILLVSLIAWSAGYGQKPADYAYLNELYKDKEIVYLCNLQEFNLSIVQDELKIDEYEKEERYYISERSSLYGKESVNSSYFHQLKSVQAYVLSPRDNAYVKFKVRDFETNQTISRKYFYDDIVTTTFDLPELRKNAISVVETRHQITDPHISLAAYWSDYFPVLNKKVILITDPGVDLEISYFHMTEQDVTYTKTTKGKKIVHSWEKSNLPPMKFEEGSPNPRYFLPHMVIRIKGFTTKDGKEIPVLRDLSDLHNWYTGMLSQMKLERPELIADVVKGIVDEQDTERQKVAKVFDWVKNNIKYIAIEDGLGGFIPRDADLVLERRYGDCKDMSNLIVHMLGELGIDGHHTWIGTRDIPYSYKELPSPLIDNHMIAAYKDKETGQFIFLDATDSHIAFGLPTQFIQGKEALINLKEGFVVDTVPIVPAPANLLIDTVSVRIENGKLKGFGRLSMAGYFDNDFRHALADAKDEEQKRARVKSMSTKGNNKFKLNEYKVARNHMDSHYDYSFEIDSYIVENGDELYVNLNLDRIFDNYKELNKDRKLSLEDDFHRKFKLKFRLELPENYSLDYLPEDATYSHPLFGFDIRYTAHPTYIDYELVMRTEFLLLDPEHFEAYNRMFKQLKSAYKETVVLKRN
jgi:transglutaminase-like putative cysteine protease